jgi:hypothetical protein
MLHSNERTYSTVYFWASPTFEALIVFVQLHSSTWSKEGLSTETTMDILVGGDRLTRGNRDF